MRRRLVSRHLGRRMLLLAPVLFLAALAGALSPLLNVRDATTLACGLGSSPTMMARVGSAQPIPALLQPVTQNTPADAPVSAFATDFVIGQPINFTEDLTNMVGVPPANTIHWGWTFGDGATSSIASPTHTFATPGTYRVFSYVDGETDPANAFDGATIHIVAALPARPPVIVVHASAAISDISTPVLFDASASHSLDGSPLTFFWNFADSHTSTKARETHTFAPLGNGGVFKSVVALVVTDAHGAKSVAYLNIEIVPEIPQAHVAVSSSNVVSGDSVSFDASSSTAPQNPPNDVLAGYTWNFGDGSPQITTQSPEIRHTFQREGTFTVTVQAIDQQGYPGVTTLTVTVAHNWTPLVLGILAALVAAVGGFFAVRAQRRRNALIRQRVAAMELARARAVNPRTRSPQRTGSAGAYPPGDSARSRRVDTGSRRDPR